MILEVKSTNSISGLPFAVESVRELNHIASNTRGPSPSIFTCAFSTTIALKPL